MKIYSINLTEISINWDYYDGFVICANNEDEVRKIAKNLSADEGREIWEIAEIQELGNYTGNEKKPFLILGSFNAG